MEETEEPTDAEEPSPSGESGSSEGETDEVVSPTDEVPTDETTEGEGTEEEPTSSDPSQGDGPASPEGEVSGEPTEDPTEEPAPFDQSQTVDGVIITVKADPGVFPADAVLSVEQVPVYQQAQADAAVEEVRDENQTVAVSYTFDIKVINPDTGEEYQPAEGQTVNVSFALAEVADENLETQVYHVTEEETTGELTAEALDVTQEDSVTATVETDGFSIYQVEFNYNKLEYVLPGDTSVAMSES